MRDKVWSQEGWNSVIFTSISKWKWQNTTMCVWPNFILHDWPWDSFFRTPLFTVFVQYILSLMGTSMLAATGLDLNGSLLARHVKIQNSAGGKWKRLPNCLRGQAEIYRHNTCKRMQRNSDGQLKFKLQPKIWLTHLFLRKKCQCFWYIISEASSDLNNPCHHYLTGLNMLNPTKTHVPLRQYHYPLHATIL